MNVTDRQTLGQPPQLPTLAATPTGRVPVDKPKRWKGIHRAPRRRWRWLSFLGSSVVVLVLIAAGLVAAGSPARAGIGRCDTTTAVYTGVITNAYIWMPASTSTSINCYLYRGDTGGAVKTLQTALNKCYGKSLSVDGQFGPRTQLALADAQRSHGLTTRLGAYTDRDAWTLRFYGISGLRPVCARIDGPILDVPRPGLPMPTPERQPGAHGLPYEITISNRRVPR